MVIHSASDPRPRTTLCGDYFYNYFSRGLDILFDGQVFKLFSKGSLDALDVHVVFAHKFSSYFVVFADS